jgi:hypothetical protein
MNKEITMNVCVMCDDICNNSNNTCEIKKCISCCYEIAVCHTCKTNNKNKKEILEKHGKNIILYEKDYYISYDEIEQLMKENNYNDIYQITTDYLLFDKKEFMCHHCMSINKLNTCNIFQRNPFEYRENYPIYTDLNLSSIFPH